MSLLTLVLLGIIITIHTPRMESASLREIIQQIDLSAPIKNAMLVLPSYVRLPEELFPLKLINEFYSELSHCTCMYHIELPDEPYQICMNNNKKLAMIIKNNNLFVWDITHKNAIHFCPGPLLFSLTPIRHMGIAIARTEKGHILLFSDPATYANFSPASSLFSDRNNTISVTDDEECIVLSSKQGGLSFFPTFRGWENYNYYEKLFDNFHPLIAHPPGKKTMLIGGPSGSVYEYNRITKKQVLIYQNPESEVSSLGASIDSFLIGYHNGDLIYIDRSTHYTKVIKETIDHSSIKKIIAIAKGSCYILLTAEGITYAITPFNNQLHIRALDITDEWSPATLLAGNYAQNYFAKSTGKEKFIEIWKYSNPDEYSSWTHMILIIKLRELYKQNKKVNLNEEWLTLLTQEELCQLSTTISNILDKDCLPPKIKLYKSIIKRVS